MLILGFNRCVFFKFFVLVANWQHQFEPLPVSQGLRQWMTEGLGEQQGKGAGEESTGRNIVNVHKMKSTGSAITGLKIVEIHCMK